ncbi:hypothetical protein KDW_18590 [Dictyobacter vulcani]|uniref:Response regulatory domain-containing protein n=1 Tax=Dictyobacter vulcani TaxID=2607529 RepID=A0A5J4KMP0_9CHLR|nr:response regulator [Dictyobacter vulcani]GER87697.1 hypothetical protein KDW_18590 [Dictyobacter vulcani]
MKGRILVVDDDVGIQECLQIVLETEGYEVFIARDGMQALEMLDATTPDLIILDLMMPRMNGYEFVKTLEQQGRHAHLPIILLTADPHVRKQASQMAVDAYLMKPFELLDLLDTVEKTLP